MIYLSPIMEPDYREKLTKILNEMGVPYKIAYSDGVETGIDDGMTEEELHFLWRLVVERMNQ
jgi:hypothetical protein